MKNDNVDDETVQILNDLIKINNDRIDGYEKASKQIPNDLDLQILFKRKIQHSNDFKKQLEKEILAAGGELTQDTTKRGKVFRAWMDIKNTFNPENSKSVLDSCEFGEHAALKAYSDAINESPIFTSQLLEIIQGQQAIIKISYDEIKIRAEIEKLEG